MCRFLVYKGRDEIVLSKLILEPAHSILTQSYDSRLRLDTRRPHNGDGFGVGYYTGSHLGNFPCIFTSTIPAWNSPNLSRLAAKTASSLVFAHVRASTEGSLSEQNCHPFRHGAIMFMHNGGIGGWTAIKRQLVGSVADKWFLGVQGSTDSEWAFAVFLDSLEKEGANPDNGGDEWEPSTEDDKENKKAKADDLTRERSEEGKCQSGFKGFGHALLRRALLRTISRINALTESIHDPRERASAVSLLNFAVSDGHSVICSRYVNSRTEEAASLYFSSGTGWGRMSECYERTDNALAKPKTQHNGASRTAIGDSSPTSPSAPRNQSEYTMDRRDRTSDLVLIASEPLTFERDSWVTVPSNSTVTIHKQTVMIHPIRDEFYVDDPGYRRTGKLVEEKGMGMSAGDSNVTAVC